MNSPKRLARDCTTVLLGVRITMTGNLQDGISLFGELTRQVELTYCLTRKEQLACWHHPLCSSSMKMTRTGADDTDATEGGNKRYIV
jgi:hypothetical protein